MLPKIVKNVFPQAAGGVAIAGHGPQPLLVLLGKLFQNGLVYVLIFFPVGEEKPVQGHVRPAVKEKALCRSAVPPGPASLLVVAFQVLGHVVVNDKADVGFVNAHAKGVGGHHHCGPVVEKILLVLQPLLIRQAGMVSGGGKALIPQGLAHLLHGLAGGAVDNAAFVPALLQQPQCFLKLVLGPANLEIQVGPVKAGDCHPGVPQLKQGENILPHPGRGGGGKG